MAPEPYYIDVDLKRDTNYKFFTVTQNDTDVTLIVRVADNGLITETLLDHFTTITLTSERPIDRKSFYVTGERILGTNEIRFKIGTSELANVGTVSASVQLYSEDGRMTTAHFSYKVRKDHTGEYVPSESEASLIERVLVDGPRIMSEAETATADAIQAISDLTGAVNGSLETLQTDKAAALQEMTEAVERGNTAAQNADDERVRLTEEVTRSVADVDEVVRYTSEEFLPGIAQSVSDMDLIIQDSKAKSADALDKATTAKTVAETVRTEFDQVVAEAGSSNPEVVNARGTYTTLKQRLDNTDSKLVDSDRQSQLLQHGVNILNADVATPVDFEIQGRTLTSLANSNLETLKYYALADKRSKIIVDGVTVAGIGKFQKKSTTLTTADFVGKSRGSVTANPHVSKQIGSNVLPHPNTFIIEISTTGINAISSLGGTSYAITSAANAEISQHLFSFNIIEQVERQLGLIPKTTLTEKVQWIKDNVNSFRGNWHGFGSSPSGNKATVSMYSSSLGRFQSETEGSGGASTASSVVAKVVVFSTNPADRIQSDGFIHILAFAEASDGVTASTINTDFINLEIELKPTAQLNTRGRIIRVENFEGKVSGSVVENPHTMKGNNSGSLLAPSATWYETSNYTNLLTLDIKNASTATNAVNSIAQHLFSFNLIEAVERNIGKIPAADVVGKAAWLKNNLAKILWSWRGFGSGPLGNKASLSAYGASWGATVSNTASTVSLLANGMNTTSIPGYVQSDGFFHILAYAEASDGVTASTINTDYIELEIELLPTANFSNPKVPLYEVTKEEFDKIGVAWTDQDTLNRFPIVEGTQHLLNPYVMAEGENLLPPFTDSAYLHYTGSRIINEYELEISRTGSGQVSYLLNFPVLSNQDYSFSCQHNGKVYISEIDEKGNTIVPTVTTSTNARSWKTNSSTKKLSIGFGESSNGVYTFVNPILNLGTQPKPFTPRNPSYLYAETKLGAIGTAKDVLFRQDGQWKRRKVVEKEVVLDGKIDWSHYSSLEYPGFKVALVPKTSVAIPLMKYDNPKQQIVIDFKGTILTSIDHYSMYQEDLWTASTSGGATYRVSVSNLSTGFSQSYVPTNNDWKRYFNGWKYTDGTTWTSVTDNGQTATAQQALDTKPTDYTPYKLSYVLVSPVIENVTVEGDIVADGQNQMEIGSGFTYTEVDGKRTYTRTPANQRYKLTTNAVDLKAIYAKTIRSAHDDMAVKVGDLATITSVNVRAIAELYKRMNALGG